ncbi:MAG: GHKL domain-containing protein [bacterium]|nr:GHKL domain-containing protein [bacterium]
MPFTWKITFIGLLLLCLASTTAGQTLVHQNYQQKDGLPHDFISSIFQDSKGYMWFGTGYGLSRFDGVTFKNYCKKDGLCSGFIYSIMEDTKGNLWLGTKNGVSRFTSGSFETFDTKRGLSDNNVWTCLEDKHGKLWFGTEKGLNRFDGKTFSIYTTANGLGSDFITSLLEDGNGNLWVATTGGVSCLPCGYMPPAALTQGAPRGGSPWNPIAGARGSLAPGMSQYRGRLSLPGKGTHVSPKKQGNVFVNYTTEDGLAHDKALSLTVDKKGNIWAGTAKGLSCFGNGKWFSYTTKNGLENDYIKTLHVDRQGGIWMGTLKGATRLWRGRFVNYSTENGLPYNVVHAIMQDSEGNTWLGTGSGVCRLRYLNVVNFSQNDGLVPGTVKALMEDSKGNIWIGTGNGLDCYEPGSGKFESLTIRQGLVDNNITELFEDGRGNIWILTALGISAYSPKDGEMVRYTEKTGLPGTGFNMMETRQGTTWLGTSKGAYTFDRGNGTFSPAPFKIPSLSVTHIMEDRGGGLWFVAQSGLFRYDGRAVKRFTKKDGLPGNGVRNILEDREGRIWISTEEGISRYYKDMFRNYTTDDGLPDNLCFFAVEDGNGALWISTAGGLVYFDGRSFRIYTAARHGLAVDTWNTALSDSAGRLWLGSAFGVTRLETPSIRANRIPPPIFFSKVQVMDNEVRVPLPEPLNFNQNYLRFNFTGLCYSAPHSVRYRYRLDNAHYEWHETADGYVSYPYLPPGEYSFEVKAINNDGVESTEPAEFKFIIQPPFWKTLWFQAFLVLLLSSVPVLTVLWKYKRAEEKMELKVNEVELKNRTRQLVLAQRMELMGMLAAGAVHDLKNLLGIIIGYVKIVGKDYNPEDRNYKAIERIKGTTSTAVQVVKQILSFTRLPNDEDALVDIAGLLDDMVDVLRVTQPREIDIQWRCPASEIMATLHPTRFQQLVMNLCINAVHAMPTGGELKISLAQKENGQVLLEISDTGAGISEAVREKIFDPLFTTKQKGEGTGLGLFVVKQIVDEYNGTIEVQSRPGQGTMFLVAFAQA